MVYARVSGPGQKADLAGQVHVLRDWAQRERPTAKLMTYTAIFRAVVWFAQSQTKGVIGMRASGAAQPLAYHLRLPDAAQPMALHLLSIAHTHINAAITALWPRLDEFSEAREGPAWKHVEQMYAWPEDISNRLGRCFAEQAGRILRAQATRKHWFALMAPIFHPGMILPANEQHKQADKNRWQIRQDLAALQSATEDGSNYLALLNLIEQACNYYLEHDAFPKTYEQMQEIPVLKAAQLTYAADDGREHGQAYQLRYDLDQGTARLWLRTPEDDGTWDRHWRDAERATLLKLPPVVVARLRAGECLAPTLRVVEPSDGLPYVVLDLFVDTPTIAPKDWMAMQRVLGFDWGVRTLVTAIVLEPGQDEEPYRQVSRPFFLDTGGFDGRQARNRQQIDRLKQRIDHLTQQRDALPQTDPHRESYTATIAAYAAEKQRCWRKYAARNRELAHLTANVLILLATVFRCEMLVGESLKTLKSVGRGRGKKGRWQKWRNNTTIRGELWRVLHYKCFLFGIRLVSQKPEHTSHTCPRCGKAANTYAAPDRLETVIDSGHWLHCVACGYHADRDYAASLNIARLGVAFLLYTQRTTHYRRFSITDPSVKPTSYTGVGAALLVPPPIRMDSPPEAAGRICFTGWSASVWFSSSYNRASICVVSQAQTRKSLLRLLVR